MEERRKYKRHPIRFPVTVLLRDTSFVEAVVMDISGEGMKIISGKAILPGTQIVVSLQLDREILFRGSIKWTRDATNPKGIRYEAGMETRMIRTPEARYTDPAELSAVVESILDHVEDVDPRPVEMAPGGPAHSSR